MQPKNPIINRAINIESLPKMIDSVYLDNSSLISPNAGNTKMYTSG